MRIPSLESAMASWPGVSVTVKHDVSYRGDDSNEEEGKKRLMTTRTEQKTHRPRQSHDGVFPGRVCCRSRHERRTYEAEHGGSIDDDTTTAANIDVAIRNKPEPSAFRCLHIPHAQLAPFFFWPRPGSTFPSRGGGGTRRRGGEIAID